MAQYWLQIVAHFALQFNREEVSRYKNHSSDYLITVAEVHSNLFMALKYSAQVVAGFNLTKSSLGELDKLMERYNTICSMRNDVERIWKTLEQNKETAEIDIFTDATILNPDVPALQKILQGYGDNQYAQVTSEIRSWYDTYTWKVKAPNQNADSEIDENSGAEVVN